MSLLVGALLACAAGLAGTVLCPDDKGGSARSRAPLLALLMGGGLLGGLALHAPPAWAEDALRGPARVVDGGTLDLGGARVALHGIAAPGIAQICEDARERSYPCGRDAARALAARVAGAEIACRRPEAGDVAGDTAGFVCRADGEDLGSWMVERGLAVPARGASPYAAAADRAWGRRLGLWAGVFEDPAGRAATVTPAATGSARAALQVGADQQRTAAVEP